MVAKRAGMDGENWAKALYYYNTPSQADQQHLPPPGLLLWK